MYRWDSVVGMAVGLLLASAGAAQAEAEEPQRVSFNATDGYWIHADYYGPTSKYADAPIAILVHDGESDRKAWAPLIGPLREAGFVVLAPDLRGHGESATSETRERAAQRDPQLSREIQHDLRGAYDWLAQQGSVDRARFAVVGAGAGAGIALRYAAKDRSVDVVVCLSPSLDVPGLDPCGDIGQIRGRSVLLMAGDERAACEALAARSERAKKEVCRGSGHGTQMLGNVPGIERKIVDCLIRGVGKPSTDVVYGSIERSIFHAAGSGWIARIDPSNLRHYSSPKEAEARGLRAAKSKGPREWRDGRASRRARSEPQP